jgi:hypothetical protein
MVGEFTYFASARNVDYQDVKYSHMALIIASHWFRYFDGPLGG